MKKVKIFLGISCLTVALASVAFTKANGGFADPEYYLTTTNVCVQLETATGCELPDGVQCTVTPSTTEINRPVFDVKNGAGDCVNQLFRNN